MELRRAVWRGLLKKAKGIITYKIYMLLKYLLLFNKAKPASLRNVIYYYPFIYKTRHLKSFLKVEQECPIPKYIKILVHKYFKFKPNYYNKPYTTYYNIHLISQVVHDYLAQQPHHC